MRPEKDWNTLQKDVNCWLEAFDHPEKDRIVLHLVGTNGKGSTGRTIALALEKMGVEKVGHFISPHVHHYEERIMVQSQPIAHETSVKIQEAMEKKGRECHLPYIPYFSRSMVEAMLAYREANVPVIVMEAGIGGRDDCTNIVPTVMNVFTTIDFDHRDRLGNTIADIAEAKAGVIQEGSLSVSANQRPEAAIVLRETAATKGASLVFYDPNDVTNASLKWEAGDRPKLHFHFSRGLLSGDYEARLIGEHQLQNFGTALVAMEEFLQPTFLEKIGFPLREGMSLQEGKQQAVQQAMREAVQEAYLPGRMEMISAYPIVFIDGAHNHQAAQVLMKNLKDLLELSPAKGKELILLFGMHDGKLSEAEQQEFFDAFAAVYRVHVQDTDDWEVVKEMRDAMERAYREHPNGLFVAAGSLYLLDGASAWVKSREQQ